MYSKDKTSSCLKHPRCLLIQCSFIFGSIYVHSYPFPSANYSYQIILKKNESPFTFLFIPQCYITEHS